MATQNKVRSPNSNRCAFQYKYFDQAPQDADNPQVINIGCADDPVALGDTAMHADMDDWSAEHKHFVQGDVCVGFPFPDQHFHTVIMGDVLEHVVSPADAIRECCRLAREMVVLTIFEEWRLSSHGQHIEEAHELAEEENRNMGYTDREDFQTKNYPQRKGVDDNQHPHLCHINQFTDSDMQVLIGFVCSLGFEPVELSKTSESKHEEHVWYNWLFAFKRITS